MASTILDALPDEEVLHSNSLGTVTRRCIILADLNGHTQNVIALSRLSQIKKVTVSYPILLVIGGASLIIAAGALYAKDGGGAGIPIAIFGCLLLVGYLGSRRGAVTFTVDSEMIETVLGTPAEAAELIAAIESARGRAGT
jgi:hypothetical protein